jgi:hypothetical protein
MSQDPHLIEIEAGSAGRLRVVLDGNELRRIRRLNFRANKAGGLPSVQLELKAQVKARGFYECASL